MPRKVGTLKCDPSRDTRKTSGASAAKEIHRKMIIVEIENKYKLSGDQEERVLAYCLENATHIKEHEHEDTYFSPIGEDFLLQMFPYKWLSIRKRNGISTLNYKHFFPEGAEKHSYCDEYTVEISSSETMAKVLLELGIAERVKVLKKRNIFKLEDFEIGIDQVEGLGWFLEIEGTGPAEEAENLKEAIHMLANKMGVSRTQQDFRGYPFLLIGGRNESESL
jgi:adenylate cyclase, class 2